MQRCNLCNFKILHAAEQMNKSASGRGKISTQEWTALSVCYRQCMSIKVNKSIYLLCVYMLSACHVYGTVTFFCEKKLSLGADRQKDSEHSMGMLSL